MTQTNFPQEILLGSQLLPEHFPVGMNLVIPQYANLPTPPKSLQQSPLLLFSNCLAFKDHLDSGTKSF